MTHPVLLLGASSAMAQKTANFLKNKGIDSIGVSTKSAHGAFAQWHTVASYTEEALPALDTPLSGLVYFPGSINLKPFHRFGSDEMKELFQLHVFGAMAVAKTYLPNLKQSPGASVVFISSVAARTGMPFHGLIGPAKAALEGLTRALAAEWAPGIRVNAVAPSLVDTPMGSKFLSTPDKAEAMAKRNPLQKVGTSEDLAHAISFLLGAESNWITGQVIAVDGGMGSLKI